MLQMQCNDNCDKGLRGGLGVDDHMRARRGAVIIRVGENGHRALECLDNPGTGDATACPAVSGVDAGVGVQARAPSAPL